MYIKYDRCNIFGCMNVLNIPPANKVNGTNIGITLSVRLSFCLDSCYNFFVFRHWHTVFGTCVVYVYFLYMTMAMFFNMDSNPGLTYLLLDVGIPYLDMVFHHQTLCQSTFILDLEIKMIILQYSSVSGSHFFCFLIKAFLF